MSKPLTAGEIRDLLQRALSVIEESDAADEHDELIRELREAIPRVPFVV